MRKVVWISLMAIITVSLHAGTKEDFLNNVYKNFFDVVDNYASDYSAITGLYTAGGEVKGAATIGRFPSFRVSATLGVIFWINPFHFIKNMNFYDLTWNIVLNKNNISSYIGWLDTYFLPIPVNNYNFDIGLPYNMNIGGKFSVGILGTLINAAGKEATQYYIQDLYYWGVGLNFTYTILREHNHLPSIATSVGVQYSDTKFNLTNIKAYNISLDASNDVIPVAFDFGSHNNNISFYFDFTISKRFNFFQPYINLKFVQTINHNLTGLVIHLDLSNATDEAKTTYNSATEISNDEKTDGVKDNIGVLFPVTDFIVSTGFEFVIKIFRLGIDGSYGLVSRAGVLTLGMRFQIEDWQFNEFKSKMKK